MALEPHPPTVPEAAGVGECRGPITQGKDLFFEINLRIYA